MSMTRPERTLFLLVTCSRDPTRSRQSSEAQMNEPPRRTRAWLTTPFQAGPV